MYILTLRRWRTQGGKCKHSNSIYLGGGFFLTPYCTIPITQTLNNDFNPPDAIIDGQRAGKGGVGAGEKVRGHIFILRHRTLKATSREVTEAHYGGVSQNPNQNEMK